MSTEIFEAQNIKCGGCASNIENGLKALAGVNQVSVDVASGRVEVSGDGLDRAQLAAKLAELGYPGKD